MSKFFRKQKKVTDSTDFNLNEDGGKEIEENDNSPDPQELAVNCSDFSVIEDHLDHGEDEEGIPQFSFDPIRAHEDFVWKALNGELSEKEKDQPKKEARKSLRWADEEGGELSSVQYFEKGERRCFQS